MELSVILIGFFVISIVGTFLHFAYEISKHKKLVALVGAVNESTWEHLKIAVMPSIIVAIIQFIFLYSNHNFLFGLLMSLITMMISIIILFYTYVFIFKKHSLIYDIIIFYIAIGLGQLVFYYILMGPVVGMYLSMMSLLFILIIACVFIIFTFYPPRNFLFIDPESNETGLKAHFKNHNKGE